MGSGAKGRTVMEVGADGVALITIINPPVNSLSFDVLRSLKDNYDQALRRDDVKAIVVTVDREQKPGYVSIEIMTDTLEAARKPSVAAIDGLALGGGLEVAMACHARISTPTAQLGLPELQLGIIPGFGGTQRLPRLVGLSKALEMMLMSKALKGEEAYNSGLVDAIVPPNELVNTARQWALDIVDRRRPWVASLYKTDKIEPLGEAREILKFARAQTQKRAPNLTHPLVCIDVIEEGIISGPRAGLFKEAEAFQALPHSDTAKGLVHIFFAQRGTTKVPGVTDIGLVPRRVNKVAILGGGLMGSGIATALILSNYPVILKEVNDKFLQAGIGRVKANLQSRVKKGKMTEEKFEKTLSLLKGVLNYESLKDVDMVIEAVIENVSLKQQIFADLEKYCPPHCILASNTSTIDLNLIGERTTSQDRIVGAHFFSPAHVMPLLEIVRTKQTSAQVIVDLLDVGKKIKKTPVVVGNCTGFAVNRMFFPYTQAAFLLVERGADLYQIDRAVTKFGMPMGPFRLADLVGFGVAIATGMQFVENFPERTYKSMLIPLMQEDKRAGEATRKGFYAYDEKRKASPDPEVKKYIEKSRSISGLVKLSEKDIVEMTFFPVVNEACRVLAEGIAVKAADLDIAAVFGMGFPPYRGGILFWADSLGSKYICSRLEEWSKMYGEFFKPCAYLAERAAMGAPLSLPVEQAKSRLGGILFWADSLGSKYICSLEEWSKMYGEFFKPCAYLAERAAMGAPLLADRAGPCSTPLWYCLSNGSCTVALQSLPVEQAKSRFELGYFLSQSKLLILLPLLGFLFVFAGSKNYSIKVYTPRLLLRPRYTFELLLVSGR
ncbi:Glyoxysomal fatty acid beta-oxidation multifunctional protein MFP-a [Morella rubra]|uniref:Glyoxysomal fatty acid beta-oxidation multifunctional protein MFP-a n=1 Tax=Morella rubra TaxID=262757 RepID=A0A6A1VPU6_9ROSI|nr:Glyoxysomal fatty acid beta-oxidation multifunctional protein MFP-a [Morella rubra]